LRYVIVGAGAAGMAAALTLRRMDAAAQIAVVSGESVEPYARCLLPEVLAGTRTPSSLTLWPDALLRREGVTLFSCARAVELRPQERKIVLTGGQEVSYDRLLVATGAKPARPRWGEAPGVFTLRTMADALALQTAAGRVREAVVAGGGLVGLKAALALKKAGVARVTVVVKSRRLLSRQLDDQAAAMVQAELTAMGVEFVLGAEVASVVAGPGGGPAGVVLDDARTLAAGLVVAAKGVRPDTELVAAAGGAVGKGIQVDDCLGTSIPGVWAAGDCIEVTDRWTGEKVGAGLWPLACEQGRLAAASLAGRKVAYPAPLTRMNSARFGRVDVISVGSLDGPQALSSFNRGTYRRLVFDGDRLASYILAGRVEGAGIYTALVRSGRPAWRWREALLAGDAGGVALSAMTQGRDLGRYFG